ncbi:MULTISPECIES: hypothetical protein [unclassified Variovorax]|uniref:hypothetical protein n=1 Tax=unclassified Variovorax TaxID=663243 RepID=UPI003ECE71DE
MDNSYRLVSILDRELAASGVSYAHAGQAVGISERSLEQAFLTGELKLSVIDAIVALLGLQFDDLLREVAESSLRSRVDSDSPARL